MVARSVIAPVGRPPDHTNASIEPSRSAAADSPTPIARRVTSSSGSTPATSISRRPITSVPELGAPIETVLPRRSSIVAIPESFMRDDVGEVRVQRAERAQRQRLASNASWPSTASIAVSASENATSESPSATRKRLSTEAEVVSAVVACPLAESISATPPP